MRTSSLPADTIDALPEGVRNGLLRRADWRFLLPDPRPRRAACLATGALARAVHLIADEVTEGGDLPHDCDLVVVADPDIATLRRAWAHLRPGGALYAELPYGTTRRRLATAGIREAALYWPWPSRSRARLWLPLDHPEARAFLLENRYLLGHAVPPDGARGLASAALRGAGFLHLRLGPWLPLCAVAVKPDGDSGGDPLETPLLLCGGPRSTSKAVALSFAPGDPRPRLAVKISRLPESTATLATEARILEALAGREIPDGAPRLIFVREEAGSIRVGETPVLGCPLHRLVNRRSYRELALRGTEWLAALAGRPAPEPPERWRERLVEPVLAHFERSYGAVADGEALRRTREALGRLGPLPLVCEHRDFGPWNLVEPVEGGLGVLDWEGAELSGLPGLDLLYFHAWLSFFLDGAVRKGQRESYRRLLDPATLQGAALKEALALYADRTGVSMADLDVLRLLVWPLHARSEHHRLAADAAGNPDAAALRSGLFLGLWEEEARR